ncbi:MAG: S46 family peptidase, partial [Myxococcales bacterium]|nr:S46 family peptidase [Myxococcales bacterium]
MTRSHRLQPTSTWLVAQAAAWVACILLLSSPTADAAEGMFRLDELPIAALKKAGLLTSAERLLELSRSVVRVAHGGSGSFVSGAGLIVTNYHVAYGCLVRLDSMKAHHGLVQRGFLARERSAELHCPGYDLLVVQRVVDVTAEVKTALAPKMSWSARFEAIRLKKQAIVDRCQASKRYICSVAAMDGGRA